MKNDIKKIKKKINNMSVEDKFWDKLEELAKELSQLKIAVAKIETKLLFYSAGAVFLSTIGIEIVKAIITK